MSDRLVVEIEPLPRSAGAKRTRYRVLFNGEVLGVWFDPECSAARALLQRGYPAISFLAFFWGSAPTLGGRLGWFAERRVFEPSEGTVHFGKWHPHPEAE